MPAIFLPGNKTLNLANDSYDYGSGNFGYGNGLLIWVMCRDKFQNINYSLLINGFYFSHLLGSSHKVANFLNCIETTLRLKEHSIFQLTTTPRILWLKPSPFWFSHFMRRSFLTMALRCGINFQDSLLPPFNTTTYGSETLPAINRFLAGFTRYVGTTFTDSGIHWHKVFNRASTSQLKSLLREGEELIEYRAYTRYLERTTNNIPGTPEDDWKYAEQTLAQE